MKKSILTTITAIILLLTGVEPAFAGFVISRPDPAGVTPRTGSTEMRTKTQELLSKVKERVRSIFSDGHNASNRKKRSSWRGIVSLVCSVVGFISMIVAFSSLALTVGWASLTALAFVFGVLAGGSGIVFGIKCLNHKKNKFRGFAIAGIVLGGIEVFLLLLTVMVAGGAFV